MNLFLLMLCSTLGADAVPNDTGLSLWYDKPAVQWFEALPVGNGRMGAMVFGGYPKERVQFNESTLWAGEPHDYANPGASKYLPEIRSLLFKGKQKKAQDLAMEHFMSVPLRQLPYQPFGDVLVDFEDGGEASNYRRSLDLDTALAGTTHTANGVTVRRELFASYPDRIVVMRITADQPGSLSFTVRFGSPHPLAEYAVLDANTLVLRGKQEDYAFEPGLEPKVPGALRYEARLKVLAGDGSVVPAENALRVEKASVVTLFLAAATSYRDFNDITGDPAALCAEQLASAEAKGYEALKAGHIADHQALFRRVSLDLGAAPPDLPTDERVRRCKETPDPHLAALLFQYGRYLLIASSRPGGQPANLQGIWNESLTPPWDSKYTVNINTEMNYWPAEPANLAECHLPLFDALDEVAVAGARVARGHYNSDGWVLHHNFDLWRGAAPINHSDHGLWPTGGAWLCQHLWWHYEYSGDRDFLEKRAYPLMRGAALFFAENLVEDPRDPARGLITGPSNSPEQGGLVMGPAMDRQIVRSLFADTIKAAEILGVDAEFRERLAALRARIVPDKIGRHGQLQEWLEDKDNPKNDHRHVSHLWALHPGSEITPVTPDLFNAARQSLLYRGDGGTGWSMAWKVNLWARLGDGDHAHKMLGNMLNLVETGEKNMGHGGIYANLFDAHPPFQIDGNFGATAGIAEMLLQSHTGSLQLLPALPSVWPDGKITGLRARGGFDVDITWQKGALVSVRITSRLGNPCILQWRNQTKDLSLPAGGTGEWSPEK